MHRMRSVGALVAAAAVGVAVWLLSPAFACSPGAQLTVEGLAVPGQQATVRGSQFEAEGAEAKIWWESVNGLLIGRAQPDAEGRFVTTISIPASAEPGRNYSLIASQGTVVAANGRTDHNTNEGQQITVNAPPPPPPLSSTASVAPASPQPAVVPAAQPEPQPEVEVASTPVAVAAPASSPVVVDPSPSPLSESAGLGQPTSTPAVLTNPVVATGSGLLLGQPASSPDPAVVPSDDVAGPGAAVVGAPAVVGTPGQPGVVLGTPPPTDLGASRTSTPLVVAASVLGLALLGLGAELARRRATAQA